MKPIQEPSAMELLMLTLVACAVLALAIQVADRSAPFWTFGAGDTYTYAAIAESIRTGHPGALREVKLFWGVAYPAAAVSSITGMSDVAAVVLVSFLASLASVLLVRRLWGGWVAAFFAVFSWDWLVVSTLGGSESLFLLLLFASFLCVRRERWALAALAAAGSATVRPVGALAFLSVLAVLIVRRRWREVITAAAIGAGIALAYVAPIAFTRGNVSEPVRNYQRDWLSGRPLGLPFIALVQGARAATTRMQIIRPLASISLVLLGTVAFVMRRSTRAIARLRLAETIFAALYVAFLFTYNAKWWAWLEFPRFALPVIPYALFALEPWLPKRRWVTWIGAPVSGLLAAAWLLGFHNVWDSLRAMR